MIDYFEMIWTGSLITVKLFLFFKYHKCHSFPLLETNISWTRSIIFPKKYYPTEQKLKISKLFFDVHLNPFSWKTNRVLVYPNPSWFNWAVSLVSDQLYGTSYLTFPFIDYKIFKINSYLTFPGNSIIIRYYAINELKLMSLTDRCIQFFVLVRTS